MGESYDDIIRQGPMTVFHYSTRAKYPVMSRLEVGQGFTVPFDQERALRAAAGYQNGKGRKTFSVRKVDEALWCVRIA